MASKECSALSGTPAFGTPAENKKALYVFALSRSAPRKLWEALESPAVSADQPLGVVGATTGTCEFGQAVDMPIGFWMQDENFIFFAGGLEVCSAFPAGRPRGPLSLIPGRSRLTMLQPPRRAR